MTLYHTTLHYTDISMDLVNFLFQIMLTMFKLDHSTYGKLRQELCVQSTCSIVLAL